MFGMYWERLYEICYLGQEPDQDEKDFIVRIIQARCLGSKPPSVLDENNRAVPLKETFELARRWARNQVNIKLDDNGSISYWFGELTPWHWYYEDNASIYLVIAKTEAEAWKQIYEIGDGISYDWVRIAEKLARENKVLVIAAKTANGRDVLVGPTSRIPAGSGRRGAEITWAVQPRSDNYWCLGSYLEEALEEAGWDSEEIEPYLKVVMGPTSCFEIHKGEKRRTFLPYIEKEPQDG